jgi:DNA-directed RNA polymerase subunit N (RpoN/RPB10)
LAFNLSPFREIILPDSEMKHWKYKRFLGQLKPELKERREIKVWFDLGVQRQGCCRRSVSVNLMAWKKPL